MLKLLKAFFSFLNKNKKTVFLIFSLICVIFAVRFPWNDLLEKKFRDFQKKSSQAYQLEFDNLQIKFFPPGLEFKNLSFFYKNQTVSLNSLIVSLDLAKWLAFKKGWKFKLFKEDSHLLVSFYKTEKKKKQEPENSSPIEVYFVKGSSPFLNLKVLNDLLPNTQFSGHIRTRFSYSGSRQQVEKIKAFLKANGENINLSKLELKTPLGPLNLPPIEWSSVKADIEVKESEVVFNGLRLGEAKDDFNVQMKGSGALAFSYRGQPRLNSYNLELQIDLDKDFSLRILDLMFSPYKEDKGGFYRYSVRLIGQGSQVPKIEKLESFNLENGR